MILLGLSLIFSILLCVHVVRTGQQMYWLMIILLIQPLGGLVYLIAIIAPERALRASGRFIVTTRVCPWSSTVACGSAGVSVMGAMLVRNKNVF